MKRNILIIFGGIIGGVLGAFLLYGFFIWFIFGGGLYFTPNPPKPKITYGEFPLCVVYEVDGKIKKIEDTLICEFDGFVVRGESGKYRKWKARLKSGNDELTLLNLRPLNEQNEFGQTMLELYFYYGSAAYYMGDTDHPDARDAQDFDWVEYKYQTSDGTIGGSAYKADVAWEKYKIKLISWEAAPPIQNTFK